MTTTATTTHSKQQCLTFNDLKIKKKFFLFTPHGRKRTDEQTWTAESVEIKKFLFFFKLFKLLKCCFCNNKSTATAITINKKKK